MERNAPDARVCRREGIRRPKILAVTVLTSLRKSDLRRVGVAAEVEHQVVRLARLARKAAWTACHLALEIARIRRGVRRGFLIVTPGVRPARRDAPAEPDDQKRIMTPESDAAPARTLPRARAADPRRAATRSPPCRRWWRRWRAAFSWRGEPGMRG